VHHRRDRAARSHDTRGGNNEHDGKQIKQDSDEIHEIQVPASTIRGIRGTAGGDFGLIAVANGQQHVLGVIKIAALLAVIFVNMRLDDGIDGTAFFTKSTENAFGKIDVVAGGTTCAILALRGFDGNSQRRANRFAQLAGDAAFFPIRVAAQRMQTAEPR